MSDVILNESELKLKMTQIYREEFFNILEDKWNRLSVDDKTFVVEFLKVLYPDKVKLINESKWYNTLGDIIGIFDPTGVVDLINGISYWRQGDKLFALLSFISVLPYLGDTIAKPVVGAIKLGGDGVKAFKTATVAGDAVKMASAAEKVGGPVAKLVESAPKWGTKLIEILRASVGKVPYLGPKLVKLIEEFIMLFTKSSRYMKAEGEILKTGLKGEKLLSASEKETLKSTFNGFKEYGGFRNKYFKYITAKDVPLWNKFAAGSPRMFGGNPATRSLMRRTKWYLGLLDGLGIGNFVGPEELAKQIPNLEDEIKDYNKTDKAQKYWSEDFGDKEINRVNNIVDEPLTKDKEFKLDPIGGLLTSIFGK